MLLPVTCAANCFEVPPVRLTLAGLTATLTVTGAVRVTTAVANLVGSATLAAFTVTAEVAVIVFGAA